MSQPETRTFSLMCRKLEDVDREWRFVPKVRSGKWTYSIVLLRKSSESWKGRSFWWNGSSKEEEDPFINHIQSCECIYICAYIYNIHTIHMSMYFPNSELLISWATPMLKNHFVQKRVFFLDLEVDCGRRCGGWGGWWKRRNCDLELLIGCSTCLSVGMDGLVSSILNFPWLLPLVLLMEEIHKHPIFYKVLYIPGGAAFLPSMIVPL